MTDWSNLVPQPGNQKALLASRVFVRHYPHQGERCSRTRADRSVLQAVACGV
jgi:hypothetical protein